MSLAAVKPKHKQPEYIITHRRKQEDARNVMLDTTQYYARMELKSQFEEHTNTKIKGNAITRTFKNLVLQEEQQLSARRARLAELLQSDDETYRQQLLASESTQETRITAIRERVHELRSKREEERLKVVGKKLAEQWSRGNDELRTLTSKKLEHQVTQYRAIQLQERADQKIEALKEEQHYAQLWEQDRQKKIQRENRDLEAREAINRTTMIALQKQLDALAEQAQREKDLEAEEAQLMHLEHERQLLDADRKNERKLEEQRLVRQDLDVFNKARIALRHQEVQEALDRDMKILDEFMKTEHQEKEKKIQQKEKLRKEMQMYREHLIQAKQLEKKRQEEIQVWNRLEKEQVRVERTQIEAQIVKTREEEALKHVKAYEKKQNYSRVLQNQIHDLDEKRKEERRLEEQEYKDTKVNFANQATEAAFDLMVQEELDMLRIKRT